MDLKEQLRSKIDKGCRFFDMEAGIVSRVDGEQYHIVVGITKLPFFKDGDVFDLNDTYCREVVESRETVCFNQVSLVGRMRNHPAYRSVKLESYIGTPILVDRSLWGTVNFSSLRARAFEFEHRTTLPRNCETT